MTNRRRLCNACGLSGTASEIHAAAPALFQSSRTELEQQQQALSASLQELTQRYTHLDQLEQQIQQFQTQQQQLSTQHSKLEALMRTVQQMAGLEAESLQLNRFKTIMIV